MDPVFTPRFTVLLAANVSFFMGHSIYLLLPKFMVTDLGVGEMQIGQAMAIFGLFTILSLPLVGTFSDRFGRRVFMFAGASLIGLTSLVFTRIDDFGVWLLCLRALQGVAFPCWFVCCSTLVVDSVDARLRGRALGIFGISTLITHGISPSVAEWLASRMGFEPIFYLSAFFCLSAIVLTLFLDEPELKFHGQEPSRSIWQLLQHGSLTYIVLTTLLAGLGFGAALTFSQPLALEVGLTTVSYFIIAYSVSSILVRVFFSHLTDHAHPRRIVIPSLLIMACGILLLTWLNSYLIFILAGVLVGLGHSLNYPTMNALLINIVRGSERAKGMSLFVGGFNIGVTLGQALFGYVAAAFCLRAVFPGAAMLVALGGITFYLATVESSK